ncbi:aminodeoxychorismate synthase component I [Actinoplanes subtropicus]|uniref:aminodeoxychorismate synthase component I n=1 Tax=Actinoplanes subtropicus TaxID=543632 RepID=UPI0004C3EF1C|nr:aminodeoxychorismate synthase component I [Actinoplanes subtropicus]
MRTLLVDNLDSYTYNLFQLIAQVQGTEPVVVRNDEEAPDLSRFDNVVISPGPGHPAKERDFGLSARVLAEASVPVLGVCLGHQGIGVLEGATVEQAPQARHGHLARVRHDGRGLFAGIPQEFTAVRYHSLRVREPLPASLAATAWAEDGVLMGLRHRERPLWGVQFHPESVLTEHGHRLLANFRDLSRTRRLTPGWTAPGRTAYKLEVRVLPVHVDAEVAFTRRFARSANAFWLDSSRVEPGLSRFSFFGDGNGPLAERVSYDVSAGTTQVQRPGEPLKLVAGSVFDYLRHELARRTVDDDPSLPFAFTGGYVGYFGYEMKGDCGAPNKHRAATPDACWLFADRLVAVDHQERRTYLVCLAEDTAEGRAGAAGWLDETMQYLRELPGFSAPSEGPGAGSGTASPPVEPWLVRGRERYLADIEECHRQLLAGESYEICLTNAAWLPATADPLGYHLLLRRLNPAPYAAYLQFGDLAVASSSPERFLTIDRDGMVETKPIKGTAHRDERPEVDERLRDALAEDPKTRAENLMIVDLLRNDLGRVSEVGSVHVPKLMATESYATVHQLVSTIRGRLREGLDAIDCVRACFPGGSMTGAPKLRTLEIIDSLETQARGVYSGAIGFLGCNGTADLNIVIRTAVFAGDRMHIGAGGAVVLDSDPVAEYDEMLLKMAAPIRAYWAAAAAHGLRGINPVAPALPRAESKR